MYLSLGSGCVCLFVPGLDFSLMNEFICTVLIVILPIVHYWKHPYLTILAIQPLVVLLLTDLAFLSFDSNTTDHYVCSILRKQQYWPFWLCSRWTVGQLPVLGVSILAELLTTNVFQFSSVVVLPVFNLPNFSALWLLAPDIGCLVLRSQGYWPLEKFNLSTVRLSTI